MNKIYTIVLLLLASTANAEVDWQKYQEKDEMTGQVSDPVALIAVNWGQFYPEVEFGCSEDFAYFQITTYQDTMPHTFVNQYGGISTQIRINWGDGNVYTYNPVQRDFSNRFFLGVRGFDPLKINPDNFKLELVSSNGTKYHIGAGSGYMVERLLECKSAGLKLKEEKEAKILFEKELQQKRMAWVEELSEIIARYWETKSTKFEYELYYIPDWNTFIRDSACKIMSYEYPEGTRVFSVYKTTSCFGGLEEAIEKAKAEFPPAPDNSRYEWYVGIREIGIASK